MSQTFTTQQVQDQKERFEAFMKSANLAKIGQKSLHFMFNDAKDGRYNDYVYLGRVLRIVAKVQPAMYHPDECREFYRQILHRQALEAYLATLPPVTKD